MNKFTNMKKTSASIAVASNNVLAAGRIKSYNEQYNITKEVVEASIEIASYIAEVEEETHEFILPSWLDAYNAKVNAKAARR